MSMHLPPYPKATAATVAGLQNRRQRYAQTIAALRDQLTTAEDAFTNALSVADQREATRQRLADMAARNRKRRI